MNDVDLSALRRQSSSEAESKSNAPRRRLRWYVVAPALLALGFLWVFASSLVEFFEPVVEVSIVRPASAQSGEGQSGEGQRAGQLLFQAAGWVEPDPFAIQVPALTQGIVAELLVEEGDRVEEGQVIARLIAEDAELEHRSAIAKLEAAEVELERARELERILQRDFDAALAVTRDLRVHEAHVEAWAAKTKAARAAVETAREDLGVAQFELETQEFLRGKDANSKWELDLAIAKRNAQKARLAQREAELETLRAEQKREAAELARVQGDFELRSQERLELVRAQEQVRLSEALAQGARAARDIAALRLSRVQVRSPRAGIVLERQAEAGSSVGPGAGGLVSIYDPERLRIRVDVPQAQVAAASRGQRAEIRCDVRRGRPYTGEVLRIIDRADIQKVTLEVQVRVQDPDELLKPDMLCQVSVYGQARAGGGEGSEKEDAPQSIFRLPSRVLIAESKVYVIDGRSGRVALRELEVLGRDGDEVLVRSGVDASSKVIDRGRASVQVGSRVVFEGSR